MTQGVSPDPVAGAVPPRPQPSSGRQRSWGGGTTPAARARQRSDYASLVLQFALKDFKIRYTHSLLGYTWSVVNPLVFCLMYYIVFSLFMHFQIEQYPAFLLLGVVMWNFFSEGSARGTAALLTRADILSKIVLPREIVVYSALLSAGLTFVINLAVLLLVIWLGGVPVRAPAVCAVPLLIDLVALTLGVSLLLAPLYVRFRDIGYLWGIVLQVGFWGTPIFYSDVMVPERWRWLVWWNPVARIIGDSRRSIVYGLWPGTRGLIITTAYSLGVCLVGVLAFRRLQARIVEYL
jgi:ABC-type polysaccharide/polyol phosphate export permease